MNSILLGLLAGLGSFILVVVVVIALVFHCGISPSRIRLTNSIPGAFDEEQLAQDEERELAGVDDVDRDAYFRAKVFAERYPPRILLLLTITLSQFLSIQEKGVAAWEFLGAGDGNAGCTVDSRTELSFYGVNGACSVQTNLPVPRQNETYYWEVKLHEKPADTIVSVGLATKPYPSFRLPGWNKSSFSYSSNGTRRVSQPLGEAPNSFGGESFEGDVIGCGWRPRTGTIFFTRNGKKLEDVAHGQKLDLFPTVGAKGPCTLYVNLGQMGFVYIEANVKKWGLAPMVGAIAPPPQYGVEGHSILLEEGSKRPLERYTAESVEKRTFTTDDLHGNRTAGSSRMPKPPRPLASSNTDISLQTITDLPPDYTSETSSAAPST